MKVAIFEKKHNHHDFVHVYVRVKRKYPSAMVDMISDFDDLLKQVQEGNYDAIYAREMEDYTRDANELAILIGNAIHSNTQVIITDTFQDLTKFYKINSDNFPLQNFKLPKDFL